MTRLPADLPGACRSTFRTAFLGVVRTAAMTLVLTGTSDVVAQNEAVPSSPLAVKIRQGLLYGHTEMGSLLNTPGPVRPFTRQRVDNSLGDSLNDTADPWVSFDKVQHATFGFLFTVGSQYAQVNKVDRSERASLPISVGVSAAVGLSKELYDWRRGRRHYFSKRDLIADGVGIAFAALLISL